VAFLVVWFRWSISTELPTANVMQTGCFGRN
jgi:hypothetical protein